MNKICFKIFDKITAKLLIAAKKLFYSKQYSLKNLVNGPQNSPEKDPLVYKIDPLFSIIFTFGIF